MTDNNESSQSQQPIAQFVIDDLDNILSPIGGGRVKYTCLDVSKRYLALGANTGSLYFFERKSNSSMISKNKQQQQQQQQSPQQPINHTNTNQPTGSKIFTNENLSFTQILSLNEIRDQISIIKINPRNDNLVAVSTHKTLYIIEPNISIRREKEKILVKMTDHPKDAEITTLIWSHCGGYLFSGDDLGNLYCCSVVKARKSFFFSADLVYKCDSKLVQLDIIPTIPITNILNQQVQQLQQSQQQSQHSGTTIPLPVDSIQIINTLPLPSLPPINSITISILSSTMTKSIVINFQILIATNVGKVTSIIQIGKKVRENTKQGACFHPFYKSSVYTSRPGKRLWLADPIDGKVLSTMNFTPSITDQQPTIDENGNPIAPIPPPPIIKPKPLVSSSNSDSNTIIAGKFPMIFSKLLPFGNYLISFDENSLLLIDVNEVEVLEWKLDQNQIHDLAVYHDSIYALHGQNRSVSRIFTSIPIEILPTPQELQEQIDQQILDQQQQSQKQPQIENNNLIDNQIVSPIPTPSPTTSTITVATAATAVTSSATTATATATVSTTNTVDSTIIIDEKKENSIDLSSSIESDSSSLNIDNLATATTTTTTNIDNSNNNDEKEVIQKVLSKENIFADIPLSSEPLMVSTTIKDPTLLPSSSSTSRKIIKKKIIKSPLDQSITNSATTTTSPNTNATVATTAETVSPPTTTTTTTTSTGEVKRTVIVKKKVIKKTATSTTTPVSTTNNTSTTPIVTSPPISNPTPTPSPPSFIETVPTSTTPTTSIEVLPKKEESSSSLLPTPTPTPPINNNNNTTTNNIQQNIFKTLNSATSSFLEIKQFALNKTNEIKTDITHKILRTEDHNNSSNNNNNNNLNESNLINEQPTVQPIQQQQQHPIEILEKLTKQTFETLQLYKENKTLESFEPMLIIWIQLFNSIEDIVVPSEMIKDIVTSCFCFGINLKQCKTESTQHLCRCWDEQNAKEFINQYYQFLSTNRVYVYSNERQWDTCIQQLIELESFTKQESKIISTIYQFIDSNDSSTCLSLLESHSNDYGLLFRFLNQLLELDPIESSKFFAKQYPIILPKNILDYATSAESTTTTTTTTKIGNTIKFEYLNQLMKLKPECKNNSNLIEQWFICNLLNDKPIDSLLFLQDGDDHKEQDEYHSSLIYSNNKYPKLKSNLVEWKSREILLQIIENVLNNEYGNQNQNINNSINSNNNNSTINNLEKLCIKYGFYQGLFKIYQHYYKNVYSLKSILHDSNQLSNYSKKLLELTVFSDDKIGFSLLFENNTNIEIWSNTLETMKKLRKIADNDASHHGDEELVFEISELFILNLMGKAIGPLETIELVLKYSTMFEKSKIETKILSDWIKLGKWSLYDRSKLSYDILSGLDSHLWLKKPLTISPQFLSIIGPEIDQSLPNTINPFKDFINNNNNNTSSIISNNLNNTTTTDNNNNNLIDFKIPTFFEDNSRRHWGVETELSCGSCPICTLPLAENPESSFLGSTPATIIVFPNCGHSYHHCCIEEQGCMLCFSKDKK